MAKYEVGQILFVLAGANKGVLPVQVYEEIVRKTSDGTTVDYMVKFPDRDEPVNLKIAKDQVFVTEKSLKSHMMNNTEIAIDRLLLQARTVAKAKFDYDPAIPKSSEKTKNIQKDLKLKQEASKSKNEPEPKSIIENSAVVEAEGLALQLDDGTSARIHLPPEFQDLIGSGV